MKMNINPNLPRLRNLNIASSGRKEASILEPSRGGMGIKFNMAKKIFINIAPSKIWLIRLKALNPKVFDVNIPFVNLKKI
ncbi:unnamed protein product [marine sediment metagenome]|uniref:Uncharacterized protein n=1 Tax=marine sediment metagenome TaxID=412755 RepID=X1LEK3_9ZZZZ